MGNLNKAALAATLALGACGPNTVDTADTAFLYDDKEHGNLFDSSRNCVAKATNRVLETNPAEQFTQFEGDTLGGQNGVNVTVYKYTPEGEPRLNANEEQITQVVTAAYANLPLVKDSVFINVYSANFNMEDIERKTVAFFEPTGDGEKDVLNKWNVGCAEIQTANGSLTSESGHIVCSADLGNRGAINGSELVVLHTNEGHCDTNYGEGHYTIMSDTDGQGTAEIIEQ